MQSTSAAVKRRGIHYAWWILTAGGAIYGTSLALSFFAMGAFIEPMEHEFGWTRAQIAGALSASLAAGGLLAPIAGRFIDRLGPRLVFSTGACVLAGGMVLVAQIQEYWHLLAALLVMSVGRVATANLAVYTTLALWFVRRRSLAFGLTRVGLSIGALVSLPASAALVTNFGWRTALIVNAGVLLSIILPATFLIMRKSPADKGLQPYGAESPDVARHATSQAGNEISATFNQALRSVAFWAMGLSNGFLFFSEVSLNVHAVPFLNGRGMSYQGAASVAGFIPACYLLGGLAVGLFAERYKAQYVLAASLWLVAMALAIIWAVAGSQLIWPAIVLFGLGVGSAISLQATMVADLFGLASYGAILGGTVFLATAGVVLGPVISGYLYDQTGSYDVPFVIFVASAILSGFVVLFARPPASRRATARTG